MCILSVFLHIFLDRFKDIGGFMSLECEIAFMSSSLVPT